MRLSKDLLGKPVVTIDDGRIIGEARDIYLTPDFSQMAGIHLGKQGLLRRKSLLIPADSVIVFGIDVILVRDSEAMTDSKHFKDSADWVRLDKLQGREIDTPGGTKVGNIGDVVLDEEGIVTAYALSRVYVEGPLTDKRIVYRDAIIENGNDDGIMTIDLNKAEELNKSGGIALTQPDPDEENEDSAE